MAVQINDEIAPEAVGGVRQHLQQSFSLARHETWAKLGDGMKG
jgi:hypothetical protein